MHNTYAVASQPVSTMRSVSYPVTYQTSTIFHPVETHNVSIATDAIKSDFGKIKGVEILHFRNAQLERNIGSQNAFATVGALQVLYFAQYDRFVLSLNSWKYPLLKRIPIVGSSVSGGLPVTYTLPTMNGFFTLIIPRVENLESLANLETIFHECSSFKFSDSEEVLSQSNILGQSQLQGGNLPLHGNIMQSTYSPRYGDQYYQGQLGQSFQNTFQSAPAGQYASYSKKKSTSRWSSFFRKPEYGHDIGQRVGTSKNNLNFIQRRDINSIRLTTEVMAAVFYYPRKEVERWIVYNKEMASLMGFSPEMADQDLTPFGHSILNRSEHSDPSLPCNQPITCERALENSTYQIGSNFNTASRRDGKVKYGYIQGHSHSIHPDISGRFNNLSASNFQSERFKQMTDTSALYEATGISPINKLEQPYTFNQEDNILSEVTKPSVTERIKETGTQHNAGLATEIKPVEQGNVSFSDKVRNLIHPSSQQTGNITQATSGQAIRTLESNLPTQTLAGDTLQSSTQYLSGRTVTSTLPTLQQRIRTVGTNLEQQTLNERIQGAMSGAEHYAA